MINMKAKDCCFEVVLKSHGRYICPIKISKAILVKVTILSSSMSLVKKFDTTEIVEDLLCSGQPVRAVMAEH